MDDRRALLRWAADHVAVYRDSLAERPVQPPLDPAAVRAALGELPEGPTPPVRCCNSWST